MTPDVESSSPHARMPSDRNADFRSVDIWLASPAAAARFDPYKLTAEERQRFDMLRSPRHREEFAVSRALQAHVGASPGNTSLSHSGGFAALACVADHAIGVDLERHRDRDFEALARFAFAETELTSLLDLPAGARPQRFYSLWVMKEALAKALQIPLVQALRNCVFTPCEFGWQGRAPTPRPWQIRVFTPREDFSLAIAVLGSESQLGYRALEWPPNGVGDWKLDLAIDTAAAQVTAAVDGAIRK